uniref:Uncharacterized protein n=1 Tax=Arundo donax TaxID=35708 RepID=A0A0A9EMV9_ARUDO
MCRIHFRPSLISGKILDLIFIPLELEALAIHKCFSQILGL